MGYKWTDEQKARLSAIMKAKYAGEEIARRYSGESLRGYGHDIFVRDNFICQYCGADGKESFGIWLTLTCDHLLPTGHMRRDDPEFIVTACAFCNTAENRYFDKKEKLGLKFDGMSRDDLIAQRREHVQLRRKEFEEYWVANVKNFGK